MISPCDGYDHTIPKQHIAVTLFVETNFRHFSEDLMTESDRNDEYWMRQALEQAQRAYRLGEVPVGAILVDNLGQAIAEAHNQPIGSLDPTAHAEVKVLREAALRLSNYRLIDTTLYVTLEPCVMCVGAMVHARIGRLVYGAREPKTGAIESAISLPEQVSFNHKFEVTSGVLAQPCSELLADFFAHRREQKKKLRSGSVED